MGLSLSRYKEKVRDYSQPPSWLTFNARACLRRWCLWAADWLASPPLLALEKATAFSQSQVMYSLAKLKVPDALASGPRTAEQLASELGVQQDPLYRLLRAAVNFGLLAAAPSWRGRAPQFWNNRLSSLLREDHPNSVKAMVQHMAEDSYGAWGELQWAVRTGESAFRKTHGGKSLWEEVLKADQEQEQQFSRAMISADSIFGAEAVVLDYNWHRYKRIVDIAGAYGSFLARILRHHRRASGVLFDQPQVIDNAETRWDKESDKAPLRKRVTFVGGDFFNPDTLPRPEPGDAWVLRMILHDWSDEDSARILSAIRKAIGATPVTLLIVEASILNDFRDPFPIREFLDLHMLVELLGKERMPAQWKSLFNGAKFELARIVACRGPMCVVEAVPV